jgi:trk system potassium uptake protein TrkA
MFVLLGGGGKVGYYLLKELLDAGQEVLLIEREMERFECINEELGSACIWGDACEPAVLEKAGVQRADIMVAVTGDDEDNLIICQLAKGKFKVPFTIARINKPKNEVIFKKLGVDATISSTNIILSMLEEEIAYKGLFAQKALLKGGVELVETLVNGDSIAIGKNLRELPLPPQSTISLIIRKNDMIIPDGNTVINEDDMLIAFVKEDRVMEFKNVLIGR